MSFDTKRLKLTKIASKLIHFNDKISSIFQFDYRVLAYIIVGDIECKRDLSYLNKKILPIYLLKLFN